MQQPTDGQRDWLPSAYLVVGALLFSTGGLAIKATDAPALVISCLRSGIAALFLLVFFPNVWRSVSFRVILVAVPYAATMTLFSLANKLTTSAHAIFLQSTAPLYLLLIAPLLLKEPVRRHDLGFMLVLLIGLSFLLAQPGPDQVTAPNPSLGNLLGATAGVSWALTLAGMRWLSRASRTPTESIAAVIVGNVLAAFLVLPFVSYDAALAPRDWLTIGYLGVFQIGLAYVLVTRALTVVPALSAALLLLIEPLFNPVWSFLFLGESPGLWGVVGGSFIVLGTVWHTFAANSAR